MGLGMDDMWNPEINCHVPSKMPQISDGRPHVQTHIADKEIMLVKDEYPHRIGQDKRQHIFKKRGFVS